MNARDRWDKLKTLFAQSLEQPDDECEAWLRQQCSHEPDLLEELLRLLRQRQKPARIFSGDAVGLLGRLLPEDNSLDALLGGTVGAYRLTRLLGEGGMGRVYQAERIDGQFRHQVALKLIRSEFATPELHQRFLRERDTLARLVHPNIAQLHDGGVSDAGLPYFTLELIDGEPFTRWCDVRRLDIAARLRLMVKVCDAVQYAHRNLIVHRDLKPSNILVTAGGEPKLLDFGIAKPLEQGAADAELTGTRGTPMTREYAAPEQVLGEPVTTATDVYALGVILYLLLCGQTPYRRAALGQMGWTKAILEEAPEPLSRAIDRTLSNRVVAHDDEAGTPARAVNGGDVSRVAAARMTSPRTLKQALRGDLERIVQRALAKSPEARYATVSAMAEDLRAFLEGRALSGGTRTYRIRKFMRRHWLPLAASGIFLLVVFASVVGLAWQAQRIANEAKTTASVKNFLVGLFRGADPLQTNGHEVTVRELIDRGAQRIAQEMQDQPLVRGELESVLGGIDNTLNRYEESARLERQAVADLVEHGANPILIAGTQWELAHALLNIGDYEGARVQSAAATAGLRALKPAPAAELARSLSQEGFIALARHKFDEAVAPATQAVQFARQPGVSAQTLADALNIAAKTAIGKHDLVQAELWQREAVVVLRSIGGDKDPSVAIGINELAEIVEGSGRLSEARDLRRQAVEIATASLGEHDPRLADLRADYADLLRTFGMFAQADELLGEAENYYREATDASDAVSLSMGSRRAHLLIAEEKYAVAEGILVGLIGTSDKMFGPNSMIAQRFEMEVSHLHALQGHTQEAAQEIEKLAASEIARRGKPTTALLTAWGDIDQFNGNFAQAEQHLAEALARERADHGEQTYEYATLEALLGIVLSKVDRAKEAQEHLRTALASYARIFGETLVPSSARAQIALAQVLASNPGSREEASHLAMTSTRAFAEFYGEGSSSTVAAQALLAKLQASR